MEIGKLWKDIYTLVPEKRKRKKCIVAYCRNCLTDRHSICSKHRSRRWRAENPVRALYIRCKHDAKARNIGFELSREDFIRFAKETGYEDRSIPKGKFDLTIERIDAREPYRMGNIEVLTRSENSKKGQQDRIDAYIMSKI